MKNNVLILFLGLISSLNSYSQSIETDCQRQTKTAVKLLVGSEQYAQDIPKAMELLTQYANEGCDTAQLKLGETYKKAQYVTFDPDKAFYFTKKAADQGNIKATLLLQKLCKQGVGCKLNEQSGLDIYASKLDVLPCEKKTQKAFEILKGSTTIVANEDVGLNLLTQYADKGCADAQYLVGKIYKRGFRDIAINYDKAFSYFQKAADQNYARAYAHLGQLYERGNGCKLDYDKALELFERCYELGDDMGAYCIGYDYMKGLGNIEQNYAKAIEWFEKSEYPMAYHWLAVLNYFGFGMPVDKDKAIELLVNNDGIYNSPRLLAHLEANKNNTTTILGDFEQVNIAEETQKINEILTAEQTVNHSEENDKETVFQISDISGNWQGKLVELDWSGEQIVRDFPVTIELNEDKDTSGVFYNATIKGITNTGVAIPLDQSLYFQNFKLSVPKLYKDNLVENLELSILSADFEVKTINHIQYLTAYVDSKILNWNEPGTPMLLVLANKSITSDNGVKINDDLINALLDSQGENFITLFPNPFEKDLLIQYELAEESFSTVEVYSLDGMFYKKMVDNEKQSKGEKLYHLDGSNLSNGVYVVKVTTNNSVYTKLIIKE